MGAQLVWIGQGVAAEAISEALEQGGALAGAGPLDGALGGGAHRQYIHAVHLFAGHAEGGRLAPDLRITGGAVVVHTNGPLVVLHHKQDRQLPEGRHVQALVELTDVAGAIAEEGGRDRVTGGIPHGVALVAAGEGCAEGHRNALADEGIAPQQVVLLGKKVHGAAAALAAAGFLTEQLAHHLPGRHAAAEGVHVVAVGAAKPVVLQLHRLDHARAYGLLAVVEVHEAKHLAAVVHLRALVLKAPAQGHVAIEHQTLVARHRGGHRWVEILQALGMGTDQTGVVCRTGGSATGCRSR